MIDRKINADGDVAVLKVESEWHSRGKCRCSNTGARLEYSGSSNELDDNNVRWLANAGMNIFRRHAAATRDQFCVREKIHSPENALYLSASRTNQ